jgi:uncharacterized membrane protein YidH (DUF202 family)
VKQKKNMSLKHIAFHPLAQGRTAEVSLPTQAAQNRTFLANIRNSMGIPEIPVQEGY